MSRYIKYDTALRYIKDAGMRIGGVWGIEATAHFEHEPSIDIVRCGECKKANTSECSLSYWDDDWGEWRIGYAGDNWYCADGEREGE